MAELFRVFSRKIAFELRKLGYKCVKTEPNKRHPELDCYLFIKTPEIQEIVAKLSTEIRETKYTNNAVGE